MEALQKVKNKVSTILDAIRSLTVRSEKELLDADGLLKAVKALAKEIRAGYDDIIKKTHAAWKGAIAQRDVYLDPVLNAEKIIKGKMAPYLEARERKRREVEERARKEREEAERKFREAEIARMKEIEAAKEAQEYDKAEQLIAEAPPPVEARKIKVPEKVKLNGTHMTTSWNWEVVDEDLVPRPFLMLDRVKINKHVQAMKDKTNIPGIKVFQKTGVSTRG